VLAVYRAAKAAVEQCRAGKGPVLIEAKTHRMRGHAQHDPAEYVPKKMREYWEARDPIARYEKYLTGNKLWSAADKKEIEGRIEKILNDDREFAENSPMPPPELAEQGVYCEGCHTIEADWHRDKSEVMPPKSSFDPTVRVSDFGGIDQGFNLPTDEAADAPAAERRAAKASQPSGNGASAAKSNGAKSRSAKTPARKGRR